MGLFNRMKDPVRGTANVVSATALDVDATGKEACTMELIVQGEGLTPTAVAHRDKVSVLRWPRAGDVLPVTVDRSDPDKLEVDWDAVPIRGQSLVATPVTPGQQEERHSIRDEHPEIPPEAAEIVDRIAAMFPGAQIGVGEPSVIDLRGGVIPGLMGLGAPDRISQLERLSKLHEEGALTDDEFEAEKRRVLEDGS